MSQTSRLIARLNDLLRTELGSLDGIHSTFQWTWSEDSTTLVPVYDANGHPVVDIVCACGTNVRVHQPSCQTLLAARTRFERVKCAPNITRRWMLCRWRCPPPVSHWIDAFGTTDDYPANGTYIPVSIQVERNPRLQVLNHDELPTEDDTWERIKAIRAAKTLDEITQEWEHNQIMRESKAVLGPRGDILYTPPRGANWWRTHDILRDSMTTYGQRPGSKSGSASYPTTEPKEPKEKSSVN